MGPSGTCWESCDHPRDHDEQHRASTDKSTLASKTPETRARAGPSPGSLLKLQCLTRSMMWGRGGLGQEGTAMGCCFPPLSPSQGGIRERDRKSSGSQDPALKLGGAW